MHVNPCSEDAAMWTAYVCIWILLHFNDPYSLVSCSSFTAAFYIKSCDMQIGCRPRSWHPFMLCNFPCISSTCCNLEHLHCWCFRIIFGRCFWNSSVHSGRYVHLIKHKFFCGHFNFIRWSFTIQQTLPEKKTAQIKAIIRHQNCVRLSEIKIHCKNVLWKSTS